MSDLEIIQLWPHYFNFGVTKLEPIINTPCSRATVMVSVDTLPRLVQRTGVNSLTRLFLNAIVAHPITADIIELHSAVLQKNGTDKWYDVEVDLLLYPPHYKGPVWNE